MEKFIDENLRYYRDTTAAVKEFHAQVELALRSVWMEFEEDLSAAGVIEPEGAAFRCTCDDSHSGMLLKREGERISFYLALQCWDDQSWPLSVYSAVWLKDREIRSAGDRAVQHACHDDLEHEFEDATTYVTIWCEILPITQITEHLRRVFRTLLDGLFGCTEFCAAFGSPAGRRRQ
ncbi:MAG TPA: hypothetical protein VFA33_04860 [Bryobacteraceae bacterium]|nr:hypothetical protein [Bryobacteraceae bacterium]